MKHRKERSKSMKIMRLWSGTEAVNAVPYLRSIIGSLREHWLEVLNAKRQLEKATQKRAAPTRQQMLQRATHEDDLHRAQSQFNDALEELTRIDVLLLEPTRGCALIPFRHGDDLAWYVFDLFAKPGLVGWRNHHDPMEECRSLTLLDDATVNDSAAPVVP